MTETLDLQGGREDQKQLAERLQHKLGQGVELIGLNGLFNQLTKNVLETALDPELA